MEDYKFVFVFFNKLGKYSQNQLEHRHNRNFNCLLAVLTLDSFSLFSKWIGAFPLPTKEEPGVAITLFKVRLFSRFFCSHSLIEFMILGLPKVLTTDQGTTKFKNALNEKLKELKIKHHLTTQFMIN